MKTNILATTALITSIGLLSAIIPYAQAVDVPSTATIIPVCGIVTTPGAISYGPLAPNATSTDQTLSIRNTGNAKETMFVRGTDWRSANSTSALLVGATHYTLTFGQAYTSKTALTSSDVQFTTLNNNQVRDIYWQLRATLNDRATVGLVNQTATLTGQC
jgi:hypothetical protein